MILKNGFPNLTELNLSENRCTDFENIVINEGDFSKLKSIDLTSNKIEESEGVGLLNRFPVIENVNLAYNSLSEIKGVANISNLKMLNLRGNLLSDIEFIKSLVTLENCESLRITENPISKAKDPVHIKYLCIASLNKIKIYNGTVLAPYEVKDCRIYYWRNSFHEFFLKEKTSHEKYIFSQFLLAARSLYPKIEYYIKQYDLPYDAPGQPNYKEFIGQSDEFLKQQTEILIDVNKHAEEEMQKQVKLEKSSSPYMQLNNVKKDSIQIFVKKKNLANQKRQKAMFCVMKFVYNDVAIAKKIPNRVAFSFVINFVKAQFKLSNKKGISLVWEKESEVGGPREEVPILDTKTKIKELITTSHARIKVLYNEQA